MVVSVTLFARHVSWSFTVIALAAGAREAPSIVETGSIWQAAVRPRTTLIDVLAHSIRRWVGEALVTFALEGPYGVDARRALPARTARAMPEEVVAAGFRGVAFVHVAAREAVSRVAGSACAVVAAA